MIGARVSAGHVVGGDTGVVLADMGEEGETRHVAERPDVVGRAEPLVDLDPAARDRQPEGLEPVHVRLAARGDQQPVERHLAPVT